MHLVLIDSSAWIDYFKHGMGEIKSEIDILLDENRAALCGMVELEILQGLRDKERDNVRNLFRALHYIETERGDFINAGLELNKLRSKGVTIPASDCLIATQCMRENLQLLTLDNDFKYMHELNKKILPQRKT